MEGLLEEKDLHGSLHDIDEKNRIVTGHLASFGNKDHDGDIIVRGAFSKSIHERMNEIFFLNQHSWKQPHGKFKVLREDEKGLFFESNPLPNTTFSDDLIKLYAAKVIDQHSIGFQTIQSEHDNDNDTRIIKEIKLFEGSNVTLGANSNTQFAGFKSLTLKQINDKSKLIYKALRDGTFTDETFGLLEIALKQLQLDSFELGKKSLIKVEPSNDTTAQDNADVINNYIKTLNK